MDKRNQDIAYFLSFCIEQYKNAKGIDGTDAMEIFLKYGVLDYLNEHFEIGIFEIYRNKGGRIMMDLSINQSNLYLLLPSKLSWMASMLAEDKGISIVDAIKQLYSSELYKKLEDEKTKKWHLGPVALYEEYEESL